ncbi:hypothetical protein HDU76_000922 [Blyttiomyces sp. JEL0837]|nr:hypothetical protein HDU76_000922 [Blyttiomyces sp. JEL0837]
MAIKVATLSASLLGGVLLALYAANATVVYEKEQKVVALLEERSRLKTLIAEKSRGIAKDV